MYYDPEGLWAWGDPVDPDIANAVTGFGDGSFNAITLGIGDLNELRQIVGIDGGIETSCSAYQWSKAGGQVVGTVALSGTLNTKFKFLTKDHAHKGMGPHLHYGPKYPGSSHPKYHFGPRNPNFGKGNFSWKDWVRGGAPWRWK